MTVLSEEWRDIPGYEGRYQASDQGRIRAIWQKTLSKRGQIMATHLTGPARRRYLAISLTPIEGREARKGHMVHVLVMLAFEGPPPDDHEVDHIDNDPLNPKYSNLEYVTRSEQQRRVYRRDKSRLPIHRPGELNPCAKLTWDQVREIRRRLGAKEISGRALARELGMSQSAISLIATGRNWTEPCLS